MEPAAPDDLQSVSSSIPRLAPHGDGSELDEPASRSRVGLRWIVGSGLIAIAGIGGWLGYRAYLQPPLAPVEVVTVPAAREDLEITLTEAGVVELGGQQTFKAPNDVTVQAVLVEERQRVSQGQVLLELRDRNLQQQFDDQLVTNRINQLTLQRNREILQERRSRLTDAEVRLQDSADLLARDFISEDEFRRDRQAMEEAQAEVRNAEVEVAKAELQTQQDEVKTENLRVRLEDNQITAPIDAVVLKVDVKAGDGVQREGRLLSIGDPTQETIRLQLTTLNASKVSIGMAVRVTLIGPNPENFQGRIVRVSPQAVSSQDNADQATVEAEARLNQPSNVLIPGSAVSVEIVQQQRQDALIVPVTALQRDAATPYVWLKDVDNTAQRQEVETGLETLEAIEVVSGLQTGDDVVVSVPPEATLTAGQPLASPGEAGDNNPTGAE